MTRTVSHAAGLVGAAVALVCGVALAPSASAAGGVPAAGVALAGAPAGAAASGAVAAAPVAGAAAPAGRDRPRQSAGPSGAEPGGPDAAPIVSGSGRRIVYSRPDMHVWIVGKHGRTLRHFPVTGRADWPVAGSYRVFSKSPSSYSAHYGVAFNYMVRFAHGNSADIGFHTIPTAGGRPIQPVSTLGQPLGLGGCVRSATPNAKFIYRWAGLGTRVIVL